MSKEYLPLKVDPFRFADHATRLHGHVAIKDLERLVASIASDEGDLEVNLTFGIDEEGIRYVIGHVETQVILQCQRCMEPFSYGIIGDFQLGLVQTEEETSTLPERYDPLVVKENDLFIQDIIEDEIIVSLPIVPMHQLEDCKVKLPLITDSDETVELGKESPFKVIELLRSKRDKQ